MSESALSREFDKLRRRAQWMAHHLRQNVYTRGAVRAETGFPDWFLARGTRLVAVELKGEGKDLDPPQLIWRDALVRGGVEHYILRPSDLRTGRIAEILEVTR